MTQMQIATLQLIHNENDSYAIYKISLYQW